MDNILNFIFISIISILSIIVIGSGVLTINTFSSYKKCENIIDVVYVIVESICILIACIALAYIAWRCI